MREEGNGSITALILTNLLCPNRIHMNKKNHARALINPKKFLDFSSIMQMDRIHFQ